MQQDPRLQQAEHGGARADPVVQVYQHFPLQASYLGDDGADDEEMPLQQEASQNDMLAQVLGMAPAPAAESSMKAKCCYICCCLWKE